MNDISEILAPCMSWREPRTVAGNPFRLTCRLEPMADPREFEKVWGNVMVPVDVAQFWSHWREADLFLDVDYGQWGLKLLSPSRSAARTSEEFLWRPAAFCELDIVLGEFMGDQELLVVDGTGDVLIALPLDDRKDWYHAAGSLSGFLRLYINHHGAKYWELTGRP